jgi:hypothetical protein
MDGGCSSYFGGLNPTGDERLRLGRLAALVVLWARALPGARELRQRKATAMPSTPDAEDGVRIGSYRSELDAN